MALRAGQHQDAGLLASRRPELPAVIGGGGLVLLVALMVLKPG